MAWNVQSTEVFINIVIFFFNFLPLPFGDFFNAIDKSMVSCAVSLGCFLKIWKESYLLHVNFHPMELVANFQPRSHTQNFCCDSKLGIMMFTESRVANLKMLVVENVHCIFASRYISYLGFAYSKSSCLMVIVSSSSLSSPKSPK